MKVSELTRECQYCWDGPYGRVRCGRLADTFSVVRVARADFQPSFRCGVHRGMLNDTVLRAPYHSTIRNDYTFGLGYKP